MTPIHTKFIPIVACLAFSLAACGDDNKTDSTTSAADTTAASETTETDAVDTTVDDSTDTSAPDAPDTSVDDSGGDLFVKLADSEFGQILVDFDGNTLYLFANDPPDTATCTGGCASTWPPVFAPAVLEAGDGLDDSLFTTVDGELGPQLSYNGHPLYYYGGDTAAGDTNGQGVGGVWFVIDAEGNAVTG